MKILHLTLCLVRVKAFPENIPFSGNAIFRKGKCFHVFGCISKNFPKNIFWCLEKKKEKTNPNKPKQTQKKEKTARSHRSSINEQRDRQSVLSDLGSLFSLSLSLSLSVSLSFSENNLKWKWGCKIIYGSKVKISINRKPFSGKWNLSLLPNTWVWGKMIS